MQKTPENQSHSLVPSLKKRSEFLALRQAPRFSCDSFILQGNLETNGKSTARIGYTVTKKIGNSVVRSRIKRRLRHAMAEAVRQVGDRQLANARSAGELPHGAIGGEMVIIARRNVLSQDYLELIGKLTKGIDRLVSKGNKAV